MHVAPGRAAFAGVASGRCDIGFSGEYSAAVDLAILPIADPGDCLAVIEHAFAIQVVIAGNALKFGDSFRGRGVANHTMQSTVR
ncbi:hypothetical protein AKG08_17835 [Achromobacter piechaudii]|nr:hypothetical protein AKG08_17835 [Achromobacter piechaudii]